MDTIDFSKPIMVSLKILEELSNPALDDVWGCGIITKKDVTNCNDYLKYSGDKHPSYLEQEIADSWDYNVARIRYLMEHKNWDTTFPITLDVGVFEYNPYPILDGNHRISAAIFRGDKEILIDVIGDEEMIEEIFFINS